MASAYHIIEFAEAAQAAAFLAAISRFLSSPSGARFRHGSGPLEVRCLRRDTESTVVALGEEALQAASSAFAPVPIARTLRGTSRPVEFETIIDGSTEIPALGLTDARRLLTVMRTT